MSEFIFPILRDRRNAVKHQKLYNHIKGFVALYLASLLGALLIEPRYKWSIGTTGVAVSLYASGLLLLYYFNAHLKIKILDYKGAPIIIRVLAYLFAIFFLAFLFATFRHEIAESLSVKYSNIGNISISLQMHIILIAAICVAFSGILERKKGEFYHYAFLRERGRNQKDEISTSIRLPNESSNEDSPFKVFNGSLLEKVREGYKSIKVSNIAFIEANGNVPAITSFDGSKISGNHALKYYVEVLKSYGFVQVHRSFLVNSFYIDSIDSDNMIRLSYGNSRKEIQLSGTFKKTVLSFWAGSD